MKVKPSTSKDAESDTSSMFSEPSSTITSSEITSQEAALPQGTVNYAMAARSTPSIAMSSAILTSSRISTAASIAESASRLNQVKQPSEEDFCQIPIPGIGRGSKRKVNP